MKQYLEILQQILDNGIERKDRTGVGTISLFTQQLRFDLTKGFPAVTTKKLAWLGVKSELLWMIEGSGDERRLAEIRYGKDRSELEGKRTIWTDNAEADYWKPNAAFEGDLGRVYGVQWRNWHADKTYITGQEAFYNALGVTQKLREEGLDGMELQLEYSKRYKEAIKPTRSIDQLQDVIDRIKEKPWDRRHIVTAWNPGEIQRMALPPCHMIFQFYVANNELSCHMFQRSCDLFLGVPFNISSYALLTHLVANVCGLTPKELILTLGDAHVYLNHVDAVKEQLKRKPMKLPTLNIVSRNNINDFTMDDIQLENYKHHEAIKAEMAV